MKNDLSEETTAELVHELAVHGRRFLELQVRQFEGELRRELDRARSELGRTRDGLVGDGKTAMAEASHRLVRNVDALKKDLREQASRAAAAARPMAVGGVLAHAGVLFFLAALVLGMARFMPAWTAALIVGLVVAGIGAALVAAGARAAREVGQEALARTNQQLTENRRWIQETKEILTARMRSARSALSGITLPRLHLSSDDASSRLT